MNYYARLSKRAFEALIDYTIIYAAYFAYLFTFGHASDTGRYILEGFEVLPVFAIWLLYFPVIEGLTGQTLGKKLMGIRVVKLSGGDVTFLTSLIRRLFDMVDFMFFGLVGILVMKSSNKKQRVGDLIAGTIVIADSAVSCEHCREQVTLDRHEFLSKRFVCPKCGEENLLTF